MPSFYHVGFLSPPGVDPFAIEKAIGSQALDWLRYSHECYIVWTDADASMICGALMTVPGMREGSFLAFKMDISAESFGFLPQWAWDWFNKDRQQNPSRQRLSPTVPPPSLLPPLPPPLSGIRAALEKIGSEEK